MGSFCVACGSPSLAGDRSGHRSLSSKSRVYRYSSGMAEFRYFPALSRLLRGPLLFHAKVGRIDMPRDRLSFDTFPPYHSSSGGRCSSMQRSDVSVCPWNGRVLRSFCAETYPCAFCLLQQGLSQMQFEKFSKPITKISFAEYWFFDFATGRSISSAAVSCRLPAVSRLSAVSAFLQVLSSLFSVR